MSKQTTDFADGMFSDDASEKIIPRNENGSLRVMALLAPATSSAAFEALAKRRQAEPPWDPEFIEDETGEPVAPLIEPPSEADAALAEHFTPEEWAIMNRKD